MTASWMFDPWIPARVNFEGVRLLLVGESHYDKEKTLPRSTTKEVVEAYGVGDQVGATKLFKNAYAAFTGDFDLAQRGGKAEFWRSVCYCNYFQRVMWPPGEAPTPEDYIESAQPFEALLRFLQPDCFVVMSDRLWKRMRNSCVRIEHVGPLNGDDAFAFDVGGSNAAPAIHINHPSPGGPPPFDPKRWHPVITEFLNYCREAPKR